MSIGFGLLKSLLADGLDSFVLLANNGVTADVFQGDEHTVYSALEQFYLTYGSLPSTDTLTIASGISVPWDNFPAEPIMYWIDQIKERALLLSAGNLINRARDAIGHRNLTSLRDYIQQAYVGLEEGINDHSVQSLSEASREAIIQHNQIQQTYELPGIPFAFPYLNLISGGMWGGDLISMIGRPAVSKSYLLLNDANNAHNHDKKVLFVSMEMPNVQCARRILSLRTGVNYTRFRLGRVSSFGIQRLESEVSQIENQLPFNILSGGIFGSIDRIYAQVKHYRPDILYIDGAYLVRTVGKAGQRWERTLQVLEILKQIALIENIPVFITFQFNKTAPGTLEGIAYSDAVAQLSSIALSVESEGTDDEDIRRPIQYKTIKILKGREGETGKIRIELDFDQMIFRQESVIAGLSDDLAYETSEDGLGGIIDDNPVEFI